MHREALLRCSSVEYISSPSAGCVPKEQRSGQSCGSRTRTARDAPFGGSDGLAEAVQMSLPRRRGVPDRPSFSSCAASRALGRELRPSLPWSRWRSLLDALFCMDSMAKSGGRAGKGL